MGTTLKNRAAPVTTESKALRQNHRWRRDATTPEWFNGFLAAHAPTPASTDVDWQETPELVAELDRRLAEFSANPAIAVAFEPGYFENLKRQLADERAPQANSLLTSWKPQTCGTTVMQVHGFRGLSP